MSCHPCRIDCIFTVDMCEKQTALHILVSLFCSWFLYMSRICVSIHEKIIFFFAIYKLAWNPKNRHVEESVRCQLRNNGLSWNWWCCIRITLPALICDSCLGAILWGPQRHCSKELLHLKTNFVCISAGGWFPSRWYTLDPSGTAFGGIAPHSEASHRSPANPGRHTHASSPLRSVQLP